MKYEYPMNNTFAPAIKYNPYMKEHELWYNIKIMNCKYSLCSGRHTANPQPAIKATRLSLKQGIMGKRRIVKCKPKFWK